MSLSQAATLVVFATAYVLIATERVHRVAAALGGAAFMLALGFTDTDTAFFSPDAGIDWNVIFLLLGMMVIVGVVKRTGLFEALAIHATKRARGRPFRLLVLLVLITASASALLDNVTTVLLVAPVTLSVCARLGLPAAPYLIAEVMASNIGGTATLIGDPPNIIIASRGGLTFNDFLVHLTPFIVVLLMVFLALCRLLFRHAFTADPQRVAAALTLSASEAIRDRRLLVQCVAILALVIVGFVLHPVLGYEPSAVALLGAGLLLLVSRFSTHDALAEVEWETLAFFIGLFIMVGSLVKMGLIADLAEVLADATGDRLLLTTLVLLGASLVLSGVIDNIPYVATLAPVVAQLARAHPGGSGHVLWWALALGADLGGNATAVGASANVVVLGIARRAGVPLSFWQFTRYGLVVAATSGALAVPYLWLRYT